MAEAKYILMNGELVPFEEARIHVLSPAITYAATVFEGVRAYWDEENADLLVFRLDDHLRRLQFSMRTMRYGAELSLDAMREQVLRIIRANEWRQDIHLRVMAMITGSATILTSSPVTLAITASPYPPNRWIDSGLALGVSTWQRVHDQSSPPRVKATANYSNGRLAMMEAAGHGYDAALMLTRDGAVSEAPVATIFMIRQGKVVTPPVTDGILESITRETVIGLFRDEMDINVAERSIDRTELYDADEAFLCGSGWEISPVASVDRIGLQMEAPGPLTREIRRIYMDVVRARRHEYRQWLLPVWT